MDVPRERRKKRTEYHYANLDDEKKYFLVHMMGDFQHEMVNSYSNTVPLPLISYFVVFLKNNEFILSTLNYVAIFFLETHTNYMLSLQLLIMSHVNLVRGLNAAW